MKVRVTHLRKKVAREAATLLYFGFEKEYKQAKLKAAQSCSANVLPTNFEVAVELDKIAQETEGAARQKHLLLRRKEALQLMRILKVYHPILLGSVWRGTAHRHSDIDITIYSNTPRDILQKLKQSSFQINQTEWITVNQQGQNRTFFHIYLESPTKENIEVVVRNPADSNRKEKCEIYGEQITGLGLQELEKLLTENPTKRFLPH